MKAIEITVTSQGLGMVDALDETEKLGAENGLDRKQILRLRLLGEELFGMVRSLAGDVEAVYRAERTDNRYMLRLRSTIEMTQDLRRQLIAASTTGKNAAAKGFMGKIREMIVASLLPKDEGPTMFSLGLMSMGSPGGYRAESGKCDWSMTRYKNAVEEGREESEEANDAWDELEKSIVANIADEVAVSVSGSDVEITIYKAF